MYIYIFIYLPSWYVHVLNWNIEDRFGELNHHQLGQIASGGFKHEAKTLPYSGMARRNSGVLQLIIQQNWWDFSSLILCELDLRGPNFKLEKLCKRTACSRIHVRIYVRRSVASNVPEQMWDCTSELTWRYLHLFAWYTSKLKTSVRPHVRLHVRFYDRTWGKCLNICQSVCQNKVVIMFMLRWASREVELLFCLWSTGRMLRFQPVSSGLSVHIWEDPTQRFNFFPTII